MEIEDANDACMIEPARHRHLTAETLGHFVFDSEVCVQQLDRDFLSGHPVPRREHLGEATGAQRPEDLEASRKNAALP
jgi:hypothetical protein